MKTVLVTGGAGFVGSHLCRRLKEDGHRVISLDNYFTGTKDNHIEGVEYREGHTKDIDALVPETPDLIFHLGEYSRNAKSLEEPDVVWDLNLRGTEGVLEFWRKKGGRLVYAGSSTKFAGERADGVDGKDLSPYTFAKAANSELVANYARWYELSYAIAYFYNVYGPGERAGVDSYGTVIETFKEQARAGKPCTVSSPGSQTRAFTHVDDTVDALVRIAEVGGNDEYGISSDDVYSLLEVAHMFGGEVEFLPQTRSTRSTGAIDTSKLRALGWEQKRRLKDYIEDATRSV